MAEPLDLSTKNPRKVSTGLPWLGWVILALTAAISITWSSHKLLEQDEIFSLQTDRVNTLAEVLRIQKSYPISLEPPPYHILAHGAIKMLGPTAFALRLPALAGYLLMQFCLYFFVRNLVGTGAVAQRAGLVAMTLPALTWTFYYSAEGRPYGVLLGSYAAAALCWQLVSRGAETHESRFWPLLGLAVALALTLTVHFYGVLLLVAIGGAELTRTIFRRRIDSAALAAIAVGMASLLTTIPYIRASAEFKKHYYAGPVSAHMLTQPYRQMLIDYTTYTKPIQLILMVLLLLLGALVIAGCIRVILGNGVVAPTFDWVLVILLVMMPVFAFGLGRFVTHALEVRHSIGAIVGISVLVAVAATPVLRRENAFVTLLALMILGTVIINVMRVRESAAQGRKTIAELTIDPTKMASLNTLPDRNIYFQDLGRWEIASEYEPNIEMRKRLVLVYSRGEEMKYEFHDTMYLTATHTSRFSAQPIVSYDELRKSAQEHIFVSYPSSGWDWIQQAFAQEAERVCGLGDGFGGNVVKVRFRQ